jgi:phosphatidate cytidylyltransferase
MSNLQTRLLTAIIGGAIMIAGIMINSVSYFLLWALILLLSQWELHQLLKKSGIPNRLALTMLASLALYAGTYACWLKLVPVSVLLIVPVITLFIFLFELFQQAPKPFEQNAYAILNLVYLAFPLTCLHFISHFDKIYHYEAILGVLLLLWANDTGGYFAGRFLGKHKLYERISPKKTWEGSLGGLVLSQVVAWGLAQYTVLFSWPHWAALSMLVVVFGSLGDLVESQLKRSLDSKDSGSLIPGHGGFLDRFDGLFFCAPPCAAYLHLVVLA